MKMFVIGCAVFLMGVGILWQGQREAAGRMVEAMGRVEAEMGASGKRTVHAVDSLRFYLMRKEALGEMLESSRRAYEAERKMEDARGALKSGEITEAELSFHDGLLKEAKDRAKRDSDALSIIPFPKDEGNRPDYWQRVSGAADDDGAERK